MKVRFVNYGTYLGSELGGKRNQYGLSWPKKSLRGKCLLKNIFLLVDFWASLVAQRVKRLPAMWET